MHTHRGVVATADHEGFEFDYAHNTIFFNRYSISLRPHEADILRVLLNNRSRPTPIGTLIQRVYGANEPDAAATSIRVAIHSLRKKIEPTGMRIKTEPRVGYEIEASHIPAVDRPLSGKILIALNLALATGEQEIAKLFRAALNIADDKRQQRGNSTRAIMPSA